MLFVKTNEEDLDQIILIETHQYNAAFIFPDTRKEHLSLINSEDINH